MKYIFHLSIAFLLVGCATSKRSYDNVSGTSDLPEKAAEAAWTLDTDSLYQTSAKPIADWWTAFNDPALDQLIDGARRGNRELAVAAANLTASRAELSRAKVDYLPNVGTTAGYTRQRLGENVFAQGENANLEYSTYDVLGNVTWETNLFGRVTDRNRLAQAGLERASAELQSVHVSLFAEVARNYLELRGAQYLRSIAVQNMEEQNQALEVTQLLVDSGTSNSLNVERAKALRESTAALLPQLDARIAALRNALSTLSGELPGELDAPALDEFRPLPSLPPSVAIGNPVELLRRRPDILMAEAALLEQTARYNLAVDELYPSIQFGGNIGFSAIDFASLGTGGAFTWALMPRINWSAFNLGRVRRQIEAEDARALAALNQYEQTVLLALEEVNTALSNYSGELERRDILRRSALASETAAALAKDRYEAGLDNFLDYLVANRDLLEAQRQLAESEIGTTTTLVSIYRALGGGWSLEETDSLK
ncbi:efflux transporter outer membrane subunit [Neolewinella aurantiaca]|uniref:Efflux transporter outer membrane subunit n=1 Tax=Neolewinella aurantiaca TaxID=2602767 RepID=A0A5C7FE10_9BACT|nr:efflux transporter outer membrane subunit [Neolewinella aurantiaca]TXF88929.1 efflux transporter outer membrane subunit [Neolewinella aurantiaca]